MQTQSRVMSKPRLAQAVLALPFAAAALLLTLLCPTGHAQTVLSSVPIANSGLGNPNIMLLIDTSDSMGNTHIPDEMEALGKPDQSIGYRSYQCNSLYFNPAEVYVVPQVVVNGNAIGPAPTPNFNAARYDYYDASNTTTVNLSTQFQAFDAKTLFGTGTPDSMQGAYYYTYTPNTGSADVTLMKGAASLSPCTDAVGKTTTTGGVWSAKTLVSSGQQANFAIWYTYYRTRMALMKSSIGRAFANIDSKYRVGFISMAPLADTPPTRSSMVSPLKYEPIRDFDLAQRVAVFDKFQKQKPSGSSPAREGLARVGRHYSDDGIRTASGARGTAADGLNYGMLDDPRNQNCQRNYTIMTTDGYWNKSYETYGPVQMDGVTRVGQRDNPLTGDGLLEYSPRPIYDGVGVGSKYGFEQDQTNWYQAIDCSTVTMQIWSNFQQLETYTASTVTQQREKQTQTSTDERTTQTTWTQTVSTVQLQEVVTGAVNTVVKSSSTDTTSTQTVANKQVWTANTLRTDLGTQISYDYALMTTWTPTQVLTTRTYSVTQWQENGPDGKTVYVSACTSPSLYGGCAHSAAWLDSTGIDPSATCTSITGTFDNGWKTTACSLPVTGAATPITQTDSCIGTSNVLVGLARRSCTNTATYSYVGSAACTAKINSGSTTPYIKITCGPTQTAILGSGSPVSGSVITTACPAGTTTTNWTPPTTPAGTNNSYNVTCLANQAISAPYNVLPANCPSNSTTTCKTTTVKTAIKFTDTCTPGTSTDGLLTVTTCPAATYTVGSATTPAKVNLATCPGPAAQTVTNDPNSPYAQTTCNYSTAAAITVSPTTSPCTTTPGTTTSYSSSSGKQTTCVTTLVGTTYPKTCPSSQGYNQPLTGQYSSCNPSAVLSSNYVSACTYPIVAPNTQSTHTDPVTGQVTTCTVNTALAVPVNAYSCTAGSTTDPVTFITTTCNAPSSTWKYVQTGQCTQTTKNTARTYVECAGPVTVNSTYNVAMGSCTVGQTKYNNATGLTTTCALTTGTWVNEAVQSCGTGAVVVSSSSVSPNPGTGSSYIYTQFTDAAGSLNTCVQHTAALSTTSACSPSPPTVVGSATQQCVLAITVPSPNGSCVTGAATKKSGTSSSVWTRNVCNQTQDSSTTTPAANCLADSDPSGPDYKTTTCSATSTAWQRQKQFRIDTYQQSYSGNTAFGQKLLLLTGTLGPWINDGVCTAASEKPWPSPAAWSVDASIDPLQALLGGPVGILNTNTAASGAVTTAVCTQWPCVGFKVLP